ncbi:MAG TPA: hypothetical protein VFT74_06105 [Isosphaeraceae bacterium]|nr:hypothetical protein [Isosphaeraceae bacterium]
MTHQDLLLLITAEIRMNEILTTIDQLKARIRQLEEQLRMRGVTIN